MKKQSYRKRTKSAYYIPKRIRPSRPSAFSTKQPQQSKLFQSKTLRKSDFTFFYVIGKGGFGRVWKVQSKRTRLQFAMKEMSKLRVVSKRSINSVMNQRKILSILRHKFIVNMQYAFQDRQNLYLVMDLLSGGDLRYHIGRYRRFSEQQTKFFVACILQGLQYIHSKGIIHRDIKPENLVLDSKGYVKITDFGIARVLVQNNGKDTSGTPGYMAPQVMCRQNHGIAVDYFAVGVIAYEFMMGRRPYLGRNRNEIRDQILSKQAEVKLRDIPVGWSVQAAEFVNALLQRKPKMRLVGQEARNHRWFRGFEWEELEMSSLEAPLVPQDLDNFDLRATLDWKDDIDPDLNLEDTENLFKGYSYNRDNEKKGNLRSNVVKRIRFS